MYIIYRRVSDNCKLNLLMQLENLQNNIILYFCLNYRENKKHFKINFPINL